MVLWVFFWQQYHAWWYGFVTQVDPPVEWGPRLVSCSFGGFPLHQATVRRSSQRHQNCTVQWQPPKVSVRLCWKPMGYHGMYYYIPLEQCLSRRSLTLTAFQLSKTAHYEESALHSSIHASVDIIVCLCPTCILAGIHRYH